MKRAALLLVCWVGVFAQEPLKETRLMRYPAISKTHIVFAYAGDLWTVPRNGGQAMRLTAHSGDELFPKFSPDGRWVAFTGEYDGNSDVFVMPSSGGEPRRLTFHPGADMVLGWTPDGKEVLFRSGRQHPNGLPEFFTVSPEGGMARKLPTGRGTLASFDATGRKLAFTPTSQEFRTWKRYRGGWLSYIGIFDLDNKTWQELPRTKAMDAFPMWHGDTIYFVSDREGSMNLFRYELGAKRTRKLTDYAEYDVKWPSLGPDAIVYENGGQLFVFDLKHQKAAPVTVSVATDAISARPEVKNVANLIRGMDISPSGSRAVLAARGEIFTVPAEHGSPRNLTDSSAVNELEPEWSPDGKWIAYLSDKSGEYEIYLRPQKGGDEVRVTSDGEVYRYNLHWSPDSRKLLFADKKLRLWYVDIDEKKPILMDTTDSMPGFLDSMTWSPDSKWVAYTELKSVGNAPLWLYSLEQKKKFQVTDSFYDTRSPRFDPGGKYLYFLSRRFFYPTGAGIEPRFGYYNTVGIFAVTLKKDDVSPYAPRSDEEKEDEKKAEDKKTEDKKAEDKKAEAGKTEEKKPEGAQAEAKSDSKADAKPEAKPDPKKPVVVQIDVQGIGDRVVQVPVPPGNYFSLEVRKDKVFYTSSPTDAFQMGTPGPPRPRAVLHLFDPQKRETKPLLEGINGYRISKEGNKILYRSQETIGIVDAAPGKKVGDGRINTAALQATVDPRAEWKQMLREAWRIERDFYWDPNMGGLDWAKIGKRYESLLPWVNHRSDLNYLIGEMIAELNTSHTYVGGGEMPARKQVGVGLLGVDFAADGGYYKIAKIYRGENWEERYRSPLTEPGLKVKTGDYLIAVNGNAVKAPADPYSYFQNLGNQLVTLRINDKPASEGAWDIQVRTTAAENGLRYYDWVETNRRKVTEATGGRAGYVHVPDTHVNGLMMFDRYLQAQTDKEALVVDERFNGGGMIPDFFIEKLQRRMLNLISPREGKDIPYPSFSVLGPKVMIVNELAGSGGDAFPWFFKKNKVGPVVGTRTWGGLIGITRSVPMIDGGNVTAPEVAFWSVENGGEWVVENYGVDPDYVVEQRPDLEVRGQDPQLDKAIELINAALKDYKPLPARPKYPSKVFPRLTARPSGTTGGQ